MGRCKNIRPPCEWACRLITMSANSLRSQKAADDFRKCYYCDTLNILRERGALDHMGAFPHTFTLLLIGLKDAVQNNRQAYPIQAVQEGFLAASTVNMCANTRHQVHALIPELKKTAMQKKCYIYFVHFEVYRRGCPHTQVL